MRKLLLTLIMLVTCTTMLVAAVGPQPTAVIMLKFAEDPVEHCDTAYAADIVFNQYSNWLLTESRGQEWLTGGPNVLGWWTLPHETSYYCAVGAGYCNNYNLLLDADDLAVAHGYGTHWGRKLTVLYVNNNTYPGISGDGGVVWSVCPVPPSTSPMYLMRHEGGHAQGLPHDNAWTCSDADVGEDYVNVIYQNTATCKWAEYGDKYDPMGFSATPGTHYALKYQSDLGWRSPNNVKVATVGETVILTRADITTTAIQEVQIYLAPEYYYTLEYWVDNGVLIRLRAPRGTGRGLLSLINNTGPNAWEHDSAITFTNPFVDPYRHINISLISATSTSATLSITSQPVVTPPPITQPPPTHGRKKGNR